MEITSDIIKRLKGTLHVCITFSDAEVYRETSSFMPYSYFCLGLDKNGDMVSEEYSVGPNWPRSKNGEMLFLEEDLSPYEDQFIINLDKIPTEIQELLFIVVRHLNEKSDHLVTVSTMGRTLFNQRFPNLFCDVSDIRSCKLFSIKYSDGWMLERINRLLDIEELIRE